MKQAKRGGRTPAKAQAKRLRVAVTMRVTPALYDQITARANSAGRSITQEFERLAEHAILLEHALGGPATGPLVRHVIANLVDTTRDDWPTDPAAYTGAMARVIDAMAEAFPGGMTRDALEQATAGVRAELVRRDAA